VSGVVQVPCRCPDYCQEWCRYPEQCQKWCRNWPTESWAQCFPGCVFRRLSVCTRIPHRAGRESFLYLTSGSQTDEGVAKDKVFVRTGNQTRDFGSKAQYAVASPPSLMASDGSLCNCRYSSRNDESHGRPAVSTWHHAHVIHIIYLYTSWPAQLDSERSTHTTTPNTPHSCQQRARIPQSPR